MSLSNDQIELVQTSFAKAKPQAGKVAELFYANLFEIAPQVRPMFKGDMVEQGRMLMSMLNTVVMGLNRLDTIVPAAQNLARRHAGYGVLAEHYAYVGSALLHALDKTLHSEFSPSVKQAWGDAYGVLSGVMIEAAAQEPRPTA